MKIKNEVGEKCKITDVEKYKTFFTKATSPKIFLKDVIKLTDKTIISQNTYLFCFIVEDKTNTYFICVLTGFIC